MAKRHVSELHEAEFEEVSVSCANCGKKMKIVKVKGLDTSWVLCQACGAGEIKADTD